MLLASKYRWTDPSGVVRLRPDAPDVVGRPTEKTTRPGHRW